MIKELPKTYEPDKYEDTIYKKWEKSGFFNPDNLELSENASNYSIVMPPPNVTGTLHMGHAVMLALEDILIRYHRMKGERTLWLPGTDHAAIATQTKVEKILKDEGTDRHKLGREKFLDRVREFAKESHDTIVNQVKKMGCSCDWSREAYTMDETRSRAVRSVFKMMYDDGLIYRGERIVNWCPRCESTLADDEIEYKAQKAKLYTFFYDKNFPIAISTTRPETKLGDTAVGVNPNDDRYRKYIGQIFEVEFVGIKLNIKIIADRGVDMNFGTGAFGVTPAHSIVDWQIAESNQLPIIKVIDEQGKIRHGFGQFSGLKVKEARKKIVEKLNIAELIIKEEEIENNLSLCYRCDTPIEPLPSKQWFIDVNKKILKFGQTIKELSIKAVRIGVFGREKIKIVPQRFEKNYYNWMENLRDWCISRQIWFGHRVPVWYKKSEKLKVKSEKLDDEAIYVGVEPPAGKNWVQDEDTLDTWFSSGLWTFSTLAKSPDEVKLENGVLKIISDDYKKYHPTAVLETGYDILFFWVARMILMTTYSLGDIPFQDVYLHGLVLDERGKKMSKSKGNVIDPLDMITKYGTDATRLSLVMGTSPGADMKIWEEKVAAYRNFVNKLWNVARYIIGNYELALPAGRLRITNYEFDQEKLTLADKWILNKLNELMIGVTNDLDNYRFAQAGERLRAFTWDDLADWYLEVSKFEKDGAKGKILSYVLANLLKLWHPFTPFVTEKIWKLIGDDLLLIQKWPISARAKQAGGDFEIIKEIIVAIRNARSENKAEPARKIKAVIYAGDKVEIIKTQAELIKNLRTGISDLEIMAHGEKIEKAIYVTMHGIEIYLIGAIDSEKEKVRLQKEIDKLTKLITELEKKLRNEEFVVKAPEPIVAKEKEKLKKYQSDLEKLKKQVEKL